MIDPIYYGDYNTYSSSSNNTSKKQSKKTDDKIKIDDKIKTDDNIKIDILPDLDLNDKQYILNPLTVIIKLSILSYKPIGTKIHIQNNIIYFQEPGIFQSIARYIFNSNKSHLQYIYNPIQIACQTYLSPTIINLFISAKCGIENLMKTYINCPMTVLCLKYYHTILSNYISNIGDKSIVLDVLETEFYTKELLQKFKEQWNSSKLKIVIDLMDFLSTHENNIKSLETIIQTIDEETQKIMI
jgi:hypothetical protein